MASKLPIKNCIECNKPTQCKSRRDIIQKKFCSKSCKGHYTVKYLIPEHKQIYNFTHLCHTPENRLKMGRKGILHHNYKSDRSQITSKRPRNEQIQWRKQIFERDNYTCQHCGQYGGQLHADHIKPYALYPELRSDIQNGRTLCIECHKKTDTYGGRTRNNKK